MLAKKQFYHFMSKINPKKTANILEAFPKQDDKAKLESVIAVQSLGLSILTNY